MASGAVSALGAILREADDAVSRRRAAGALLPSLAAIVAMLNDDGAAGTQSSSELLRILTSMAQSAPPALRADQAVQVLSALLQVSVRGGVDPRDAAGAFSAWLGALAAVDPHAAAVFLLDMNELLEDCRALWLTLLEVCVLASSQLASALYLLYADPAERGRSRCGPAVPRGSGLSAMLHPGCFASPRRCRLRRRRTPERLWRRRLAAQRPARGARPPRATVDTRRTGSGARLVGVDRGRVPTRDP